MFLLLAAPSLAATLNVTSSGTYTTIQGAVTASSSGDTITVSAGSWSGCVDLGGKDLTITGAGSSTTTILGSACSSGVLAIDQGEVVTISGFTIDNGSAGAVKIDNAAVATFDDIVVENSGKASTSGAFIEGGGMSILGGSYVEISDSTFEDNTGDYGGAVYVDASSLVMTSVDFPTNYATYAGGAIRAESSAEVVMESCSFTANSTSFSSGKGGAISIYDSVELSDDGSTFTENWASNYGGAIMTEDSGELTLVDSVFDGNYVDRSFASPISGGAIYAEDLEVFDIDGALFTDNVAYLYGGAIHTNSMATAKTMTVTDTTFTDNVTQSKRGGAIEASAGVDLVVTDSVFDGNTAAEAGGAISFYTLNNSQDLLITGSTFTDNTTTSTRDAHGGAVFVYNYNATVTIDVSDSTFDGNIASLSGGGIYTGSADEVTVSGSSFTDNLASDIVTTTLGNYNGGAMSIYDADTVTLSALTICGNTGDDGGGLYLEAVGDLSLANSLIIENEASGDGGGVYLYDVAGEVVNNNLLGGTAVTGGGLYLESGSAVDVVNNVVAYTVGGRGAVAGDSASASSSSFTYNDWYSNTSSAIGGTLSFSTTSSGNITDDPDFKSYTLDGNCSNDDYIPDSTSALIDAGDPSILDADGSDSDIGAYGGPDSPIADSDGDGYYNTDDCDDDDASVNPGEAEVCDGVDNDCDGEVDNDATDADTYYADDDGDGYGDPDDSAELCATETTGYVSDDTDCDDTDSAVNTDAEEVCDGVDNDCDGDVDGEDASSSQTFYSDVDGDGFGSTFDTLVACSAPSGYVDNVDDCDDTDASINPDADEYCDGDDNDCDGSTDEDDAVDGTTWYADLDGDGYGISTFTKTACTQPSSYAATGDDCDEGDASINPGADEYCDGDDNDCDGDTDEGDALDADTYYADSDGDGYGDITDSTTACSLPTGYVSDSDDCDDTDGTISPDGEEVCDGDDNDCDGTTDEADASDAATFYTDADGDGFGDASGTTTEACAAPSGYADNTDDCDDSNADVSPDADEVCNSIDDNCDGDIDESTAIDASTYYTDGDGDGFGDVTQTTEACAAPSGTVAVADDCDDSDAAINPDADEVCDDADNNCDGDIDEDGAVDASTFYADADNDGFGDASVSEVSCVAPSGYTDNADDCDDARTLVSPDADEYCDGVDNDCNDLIDDDAVDAETWYPDADSDGYGDEDAGELSCEQPSGTIETAGDCDDDEVQANPGQSEVAYDGIDNDCDGFDLTDVDGDGYDAVEAGGDDCDDDDASIYPSADDIVGDGIDQDCDGSDLSSIDTGEEGGKTGCSTAGATSRSAGIFGLALMGLALTRRRR